MIVMKPIVKSIPKRIWPHTSFTTVTSTTCAELMGLAKKLGLNYADLINMRYHPHLRLNAELFVKAKALGAKVVSPDEYSSFISKNHFNIS